MVFSFTQLCPAFGVSQFFGKKSFRAYRMQGKSFLNALSIALGSLVQCGRAISRSLFSFHIDTREKPTRVTLLE